MFCRSLMAKPSAVNRMIGGSIPSDRAKINCRVGKLATPSGFEPEAKALHVRIVPRQPLGGRLKVGCNSLKVEIMVRFHFSQPKIRHRWLNSLGNRLQIGFMEVQIFSCAPI